MLSKWKKEYGEAYVKTYLYALKVGCDVSFFPHQLQIERPKVTKELIEQFMALWPTQSKTGLPYSVSGNKPIVIQRFEKLLKQWDEYTDEDFSPERILLATKKYLVSQEEKGYLFTKKNHKFVLDESGSELINWYERSEVITTGFYL